MSFLPPQGEYRKWTKVNPKPVRFQGASPALCVGPNLAQIASPHVDKWITVYVNSVGRKEMLKPFPRQFPVGTVIIKEKMPAPSSTTAELLTVMRKRERGYDLEAGDWQYLVLDGKAEKVQAEGRLARCRNCHQEVAKQDHIFRNYYGPTASRQVPYPSLRFRQEILRLNRADGGP
jgi:hypothetical protein